MTQRNIISILFIMHIAFVLANISIDTYDYNYEDNYNHIINWYSFFPRPHIGSCPPTFPLPILQVYNGLFASTLSIFLLRVLKINYDILTLIITLNIYLVIKALLTWWNFDFDVICFYIFEAYREKITLLYSIHFLTLGFLFMKE